MNKYNINNLWKEYVFRKQTVSELVQDNQVSKRKIRFLLKQYQPPQKIHTPRPVHIVTDATYFGERREETSWCVVVIRDPKESENLLWKFVDTETTGVYIQIRDELEALGYTVLSVTADGFKGIKTAFSGIPYQMCLVHMERLVTRGTTRKPILEAGKVLLALARTLYKTNSYTFNKRLCAYIEKYRDFLNEKTINPITNEEYWTHEKLRMALRSLLRYEEYLFTFERDKNIPKTTNSLEGHFGHINQKVGSHNGLSRYQKERILHSILLASSTAPKQKILNIIL